MNDSMECEEAKRKKWLLFLNSARDFRKERLRSGGEINRTSPGPYCMLHWMPMPPKGQEFVDIESVSKNYEEFIIFKENLHVRYRRNSYGLLISTNLEDKVEQPEWRNEERLYRRGWQYTQIFLSGAFEFVYAPPIQGREGKRANYLSLYAFEFFRRQIRNCIKKAPDLGFLGASVIGVSILGVKGYSIYTPIISARYLEKFAQQPADTNEVLNSAEDNIKLEMRIANILDIKDVNEQVLRPIFDLLWRDFGFPGCDRSFEDGSWDIQP